MQPETRLNICEVLHLQDAFLDFMGFEILPCRALSLLSDWQENSRTPYASSNWDKGRFYLSPQSPAELTGQQQHRSASYRTAGCYQGAASTAWHERGKDLLLKHWMYLHNELLYCTEF